MRAGHVGPAESAEPAHQRPEEVRGGGQGDGLLPVSAWGSQLLPLASLYFWTQSLGFWFCLCCLASSGPSPSRCVVLDLSFHTASTVSFRSMVGRKVVECVSQADCWASGPQRPMGHLPLCSPGAPPRASACPPADIGPALSIEGAGSLPARDSSAFLGHTYTILVSGCQKMVWVLTACG